MVNISVQLHQDTAVVNLTSHESGSGVATSFDLVLSPPHNSCSEPINEKCHISVDKAGLVTLKGLEPETQYTVQVTPINCAGQGNRSEPVEFNSTKAIGM